MKSKVIVAQPLVIPLVEWDEYTGRLDAIDSVEIRARVSGYLESTHFDEGQTVQKGDLLAIIDPRPFKAAFNTAKAELQEATARVEQAKSARKQAEARLVELQAQQKLAGQRMERGKQLSKQRAISQEELDVIESEQSQAAAASEAAVAQVEAAGAAIATASAEIETSKAKVETAAIDLQYTQVRAPITGRISRRYVTEGNLISGGSSESTLLTSIVSLSPIHVYFDANEQEFLKYMRLAQDGKRASSRQVKNPVFVALIDEEGYPHEGHMDFVDNRLDPNTGTMRGRAILANEDGLLTPGLFVKVRLPGSGRYDAILVPDESINSDQSEKYLYVVDDENKVVRKDVELGPISHGMRIIRKGLEGSEKVVTKGVQRIFPGAEVESELGTLVAEESPLPDEYTPVPREQWLSIAHSTIPEGIDQNSKPYQFPQSEGTQAPQQK
ncbi:efflux RND transporter periplasmic adaptor subunit [Polystyrenella longa]|nr:efflux RND transporter periplasmic adaptor subunit [Polystyrenella longa]